MAHALELSKVLLALDKRDTKFWDKLTAEEQKSLQPVVLMKFMSSVPNSPNLTYLQLVLINEFVNVHHWDLYKEPELLLKLLATAGTGQKQFHPWLGMPSKQTSHLDNFIRSIFLEKRWICNNFEINLYISKLTKESLQDLIQERGLDKSEEKKLIADFKNKMSLLSPDV